VPFDLEVVARARQVEADRVGVGDEEHQVELGALEVDVREPRLLERERGPLERGGGGLTNERAPEKQRQQQEELAHAGKLTTHGCAARSRLFVGGASR
jgi:hypothetical protein